MSRGVRARFAFATIVSLAMIAGCRRDPSYNGRSANDWAMLLRDGDSTDRLAAASAFVHQPPAQRAHVLALLRATADTNLAVRDLADSAVAGLPDDVTHTLTDALRDPDVVLRRAAAFGLGHYNNNHDDEIDALVHATDDADDSVRTLAVSSLGDRSANARRALERIRLLATRPGPQRVVALEVLPNIDTESRSMLGIYLPAISDSSAPVGAAAIEMLFAAGGDARIIPLVARALRDPDTRVRQSAARVLAAEAHHNATAYQALVDQTLPTDSVVQRMADSVRRSVAPPR